MYPTTDYDYSKLGSLRAPSRETPKCLAHQVIWLPAVVVIRQKPTAIMSRHRPRLGQVKHGASHPSRQLLRDDKKV